MPKAILQNGVTQADYARVIWRITPDPGTTPEDVLVPSYYTHIAKQLKPGARIEVAPADGTWLAELYVRSADGNSARVALLALYQFNGEQPSTEQYEVKHRGPRGWSVVLISDKKAVFENGVAKEDAEKWVTDQSLA